MITFEHKPSKDGITFYRREWAFQGDRPDYTHLMSMTWQEVWKFIAEIQEQYSSELTAVEEEEKRKSKDESIRARAYRIQAADEYYAAAVKDYPNQPADFYVGVVMSNFDGKHFPEVASHLRNKYGD